MKTSELFEGTRWRPRGWENHSFQIRANYPTRVDFGFDRMYNFVIPKVALALGVPVRNVDYSGFTTEKGTITVKITHSKTEVDMVELMLPKILKAKLEEAGFQRIMIGEPYKELSAPRGITGLQYKLIKCAVITDFPQKWKDYDAERYGVDV